MGKLSGSKYRILRSISMLGWSFLLLLSSFMVVAERKTLVSHNSSPSSSMSTSSYSLSSSPSPSPVSSLEKDHVPTTVRFTWQSHHSSYRHVWPKLRFGWRIVVGTIIGFIGAAFGSVGGVGGGGIFVPMLDLIVGFDPKSSTAISKCMIMGASMSTVYYNLKLRHPTLDMPLIDYDLAVLFQPMLMLGISIGVALNIIFADWMVTILLIILFIVTSTKAFLKGVETWKKETIMQKEAALHNPQLSISNARTGSGVDFRPLPSSPIPNIDEKDTEAPIIKNVYWRKLGLLFFVWVAFLIVQITKRKLTTCSTTYWAVNLLQIPISFGVTLFEAISIYKGKRKISSRGNASSDWKIHQLFIYCCLGVLAGMVGGLLGLGGGFILGPLFLEMGVPPQVSSATATFAMTFSSSMSVIEYYILKRFPVPYALYFIGVAVIAAFVGQHVVRKIIIVLGRASLIIFILAFTIFVSALSLGGVGISKMVMQIKRDEYMGFDNFCTYKDA